MPGRLKVGPALTMTRPTVPLLALLLAGCAAEESANQSAADELRIAPGLWEIRSAVTGARAPNLPIVVRDRLVGPRPSRRLCITAAQAADASFLAQRQGDCVQRAVTLRGSRLSGTMQCVQQGSAPGRVTLDGAYESERYALRMAMEEPMPDGTTLRLDIVTAGRRIGDC